MKKYSESVAISDNGISRKHQNARVKSRKNRQKTSRKKSYRNLQDTDVTANQGYDLFCSMNNSSFQFLMSELMPSTFEMPITLNSVTTDYNIAFLPFDSASAAQIVNASNEVSIAVPFSAAPATDDSATSFTGTTTLKFDISKMVLNSFRKSGMLALDGTTGYLSASSSATSISSQSGFAFEAWVKLAAGNTANPVICAMDTSSGSSNTITTLYYNTSGKKLGLRISSSNLLSAEVANLEDENWHHVAVSISQQVASFYVDGVLISTQNVPSISYSAGSIGIGGTPTGGSANFNGDITDVRMWSIPRSQQNIQAFMNVDLSAATEDQSGLFQLWKFTGDSDQPVNLINPNNVGTKHGTADVVQPPKPTKYYTINWLSTSNVFQTPSTTIDNNSNADLVTAFNTALTKKINTDLLPLSNYIDPNFNNYNSLFRPSTLRFMTLSTGYTTSGLEYQMNMYGMYVHRPMPSANAKTIVSNNKQLFIPDNTTSNLTASVRDYVILNTRKSILAKALQVADDDLSIDQQSNGSYKTYLNKDRVQIGPWYLFSVLKKYSVQFGTDGVHHDTGYKTPLAYITDLKATRYGVPKTRANGIQEIDVLRKNVSATSEPNWGFIFAVIGAVVVVMIINPGIFSFGVLAIFLFFLIFVIIGYLRHNAVVSRTENDVSKRENTNAHFTVNELSYDYSQIVQGYLGKPKFDMTFLNSDGENKIIYKTATNLNLALTNNYAALDCYTASSSPTGTASTITISLPLFLQQNAEEMRQNFSGNSNWSCTVGTGGPNNRPNLILTCIKDFSWGTGTSNVLNFTFSNVTCEYLGGVTMTGTVKTTIANTSNSASISSAERFNYQAAPADEYQLDWDYWKVELFADETKLKSKSLKISTSSNPTSPLATATITVGTGDNAKDLTFDLSYENDLKGGKGVRATMIGTNNPSKYYGEYITPKLSDSSRATFKNDPSEEPGITFTVATVNDDE